MGQGLKISSAVLNLDYTMMLPGVLTKYIPTGEKIYTSGMDCCLGVFMAHPTGAGLFSASIHLLASEL